MQLVQYLINRVKQDPLFYIGLINAAMGVFVYFAKRWKSKDYIKINQNDQEKLRKLINSKYYFENKLQKKLHQDHLKNFSPIGIEDKDRIKFTKLFQSLKENNYDPQKLGLDKKQSRAIGCMLAMAICDALGASTEFKSYQRQGYGIIKEGFQDINKAISQRKLGSRHGKVGIWTDDASMGIAMGYGLMFSNYEFNPILTRQMFHLWWNHGLGNGGRDRSIGLGGNISISMSQFQQNPNQQYTSKGQQNNNGNGSLMRLAPIPVAYHKYLTKAGQVAEKQSLTTHNGLQAKECARLMTEIIVNLINRKQGEDGKENLKKTCQNFKSQVKSVMCLASSQKETQQMWKQSLNKDPTFKRFNQTLMDRNWNWKVKDFEYSPTRLRQNSGYIGSYCMDGLSMALHIVQHTESFKQCAIKNADIGGDCDTVGSIAGQMAGAIYGVNKDMLKLYSEMPDFIQKRYQAFLCGYKLYHNKSIELKNQSGKNQERIKDTLFEFQEFKDKQN